MEGFESKMEKTHRRVEELSGKITEETNTQYIYRQEALTEAADTNNKLTAVQEAKKALEDKQTETICQIQQQVLHEVDERMKEVSSNMQQPDQGNNPGVAEGEWVRRARMHPNQGEKKQIDAIPSQQNTPIQKLEQNAYDLNSRTPTGS